MKYEHNIWSEMTKSESESESDQSDHFNKNITQRFFFFYHLLTVMLF